METVRLSDKLELTRVIVGCMRMMDAGKKGKDLLRFVHECMELGMNCFDHAPVYGGNLCEKTFGDDVVKAEPGIREKIKIVTKAGIVVPGVFGNRHIYYDSRENSLLAEVEASLKRLSTDHVDLLLIHRPDILGHPEEAARALEKIVKDGKALEVGVSNYEVPQFEALQHYLPFPLVANQVELSVKATDNLFNGVVDTAMRLDTGIMAWSPLGGGSVFKGEDDKSLRLRETVGEIAGEHNVAMAAVMYAWLFRHPAKVMAITGTMSSEHLKPAADALSLALSYDEWYGILAASRGFDVP